jgi:3-hydroxyacyl-CoA dehydrogenase
LARLETYASRRHRRTNTAACWGRRRGPQGFQRHFLGTHFFNPPRYLKLLEIIPHAKTDPAVLDFMIVYGQNVLGKGVVVCKDTPNFIANRFISVAGTFGIIYALEHGYSVAEVDNLTGELIGRPKTATFRLMDLIGVDIMQHVNANLYPAIPDDESRHLLQHPRANAIIDRMVEQGWLGNKTSQGFYHRVDKADGSKEFWELDLTTLDYVPPKSALRVSALIARSQTRARASRRWSTRRIARASISGTCTPFT